MKDEICTGCQQAFAPSADGSCPRCGVRARSVVPAAASGFTVRPAARPKVAPPVHCALTVDGTGSTGAFQDGVPKCARMIFDEIGKTTSVGAVHLQVHGDHDCGQTEVLLTEGGTPAEALADMGTIRYGGGGDAEEHHLTAIERLAECVPWTAGARRVMVAFTTHESKKAHSGRSEADIGKALKDAGVLFCLVGHGTPKMLRLVKAAHGFFFEISNTPSVAEMQQIGAAVGGSLSATLSKLTATRPAPAPTN